MPTATADNATRPTPPTVADAYQLVAAATDAIGARPVAIELTPRTTWNGDGFDVAYDGAVMWTRGDLFGSHRVVIRARPVAGTPARAGLLHGHYDLCEADARRVHADRTASL